MSKRHILVVDDEPINLHIMRQILKGDYLLSFAKTGQEAIDHAETSNVDLILLDVMMPEMDGFEVCRRLKASIATASIPVIFITSMDDVSDETLAFNAGAVDYIAKPVSHAVVLARVSTHLALVDSLCLKRVQLELIHHMVYLPESFGFEENAYAKRLAYNSQRLAVAVGMSEEEGDSLYKAVIMSYGKSKEVKLPTEVLEMAQTLAHTNYEKWNGNGWPKGLKGDDLPLITRIVAIVKAFVVLVSLNPEGVDWSVNDVRDTLREGSDSYFDPALVALFEKTANEIITEQFVNREID